MLPEESISRLSILADLLQIFDNSIFIQEHDSGRIIHLKCKNALERLDCTQSTFLDLNKMWGHQFEILF